MQGGSASLHPPLKGFALKNPGVEAVSRPQRLGIEKVQRFATIFARFP